MSTVVFFSTFRNEWKTWSGSQKTETTLIPLWLGTNGHHVSQTPEMVRIKPWWITSLIKGRHHQSPETLKPISSGRGGFVCDTESLYYKVRPPSTETFSALERLKEEFLRAQLPPHPDGSAHIGPLVARCVILFITVFYYFYRIS